VKPVIITKANNNSNRVTFSWWSSPKHYSSSGKNGVVSLLHLFLLVPFICHRIKFGLWWIRIITHTVFGQYNNKKNGLDNINGSRLDNTICRFIEQHRLMQEFVRKLNYLYIEAKNVEEIEADFLLGKNKN
jgi:hypothetical protein